MEYDVTRFLLAQQRDYLQALAEIKNGKKESHWIWYVFPQLKGLGKRAASEYYGIADLEEAKAYLAEPILRAHLLEICNALLALETNDPVAVMGRPDDKKLKSSMTLFDAATEEMDVFQKVLEKYYQGRRDYQTLQMLGLDSAHTENDHRRNRTNRR